MSNFAIYKKTLCFSFRELLFDLIMLVLITALCVVGFLVADKATDRGLIGLFIGLAVGILIAALVSHFFGYIFKAAQIAMMTRGIVEDELPENVYAEGKKAVKERFLTVAAFYVATRIIKGIFNQIGKAITALGKVVGGDTGQGIGSAISSAIQIVVSYLCDCCLGWVFFRREQSAVRATLEGAVVFFKHGKAFLKNIGRIFGMGLVSFAAIGGAFFGLTYFISTFFNDSFAKLSAEIVQAGVRYELDLPAWVGDTTTVTLAFAAIVGIVIWSFIHSNFIRPFVLTGVLRNYLAAGMNDIPTEEAFRELDGKSSKFAKLHKELEM